MALINADQQVTPARASRPRLLLLTAPTDTPGSITERSILVEAGGTPALSRGVTRFC